MYKQRPSNDLVFLEESLKSYHQKYPDHPYTRQTRNLLNAFRKIKVNGTYIDFSAPDKDGNIVSISSVVENSKVTLIDLWAPWCAPCIKKSKKLAPHYPEFKKKGFEAIGLLSGIDTISKYYEAIEKFPNPWKVLVEVNNEYNIYEKYSIGNSGGSQFLVNQNGTILAINPSVQEIDSILNILQP